MHLITMISITVKFNTDGMKKFRRALERRKSGDYSDPLSRSMRVAGWVLVSYWQKRFYYGGGSQPWEPLAYRTKKRKKHGVILVEGGGLQEHFDQTGMEVKNLKSGVMITPRGGNHERYRGGMRGLIELHQGGDSSKNIPARPMLVDPDLKTKGQIVRTIKAGMDRLIRSTGVGK